MTKTAVAVLGLYGLTISMCFAQISGDAGSANAPAAAVAPGVAGVGSGVHYGPLTISPELDLSCFYDTNPTYTHEGAKAVSGLRMQPLLDIIIAGNGWSVNARGWMTHDMYLGSVDPAYKDTIEKDHYGETIALNLTTPHETHYSLTEFFEYQNRNDPVWANPSPPPVNNISWGDRYSFTVAAAMDTRLGEKTGMNIGANFSDLWYANQFLYGWQDAGGTLGFSRKLTEKSDLVFDFGCDDQWSDGSSGQSRGYHVTIGVGSKPDAVSTYRAEVGVMGYDFNNGEGTAYAPTYNLSGNWKLSQRLSATLNGNANFQPSETSQNNYTLVETLAAGLTFEATSRLTTSLSAIYRREDYAKTDTASSEKRLDNQFDLYGRANYRFYRYASVFVGADVSKDESSINQWSYNRLFLEAGVSLRF